MFWAEARRLATGASFPAFGPPITGTSANLPGPAFYYLMAIPQLLGASPRLGSVFVVFLHGFALWILFALARRALGDRAGLIALLLLAFAPWDVLYGDRVWASCVVPVWGAVSVYAALRAKDSAVGQGVLLFASLVLPQIHMSAPVLWATCAVVLALSPPKRIHVRALVVAGILAAATYVPAIVADAKMDFSNTRQIFSKASGSEGWENVRWIPLKVFEYAVIYGTSEIGYQFDRGYWGGQFQDIFTHGFSGWSRRFSVDGLFWAALNMVSLLLAFGAWILALVRVAKRVRQAFLERNRGALGMDAVMTLALLVGFFVASVLMMLAKKTFFPHYANVLMPLALWPIVSAVDSFWARARAMRAWIALALAASVLSMVSSCIRYYRNVDSLNGLSNTVGMVGEVLSANVPVRVRFDHFSNVYAWQEVARMFYGRELAISDDASITFRVHNGTPWTGAVPEHGKLFGRVWLERREVALAEPPSPTRVFRALDHASSARVEAIDNVGQTRACIRARSTDANCSYGDAPWQHFGPESMEIGHQMRSVLFMHPIAGKVVRASFLIPRQAIRGALTYGLSDAATQSSNTAPVDVRVLQGESMLVHVRAENTVGMGRRPFSVTATGAREIAVEIRTENDGARVFGFDVELHRE